MTEETNIPPRDETLPNLVRLIANIARHNGASLLAYQSFMPLHVHKNVASEFSRGVVACVFQVLHELSKTPQGRHAILDLGYEPVFEDVKSPRSGGLDD